MRRPHRPRKDFPLSLRGHGLQGFWRLDAGRFTATGGLIDTVADQSGLGRTTTFTGAARPTHLDGTALFSGAQVGEIPTGFADGMGITNYTVWAVYATDDATVNQCLIRAGGATGGQGITLEGSNRNIRLASVAVMSDGAATETGELVVFTRSGGVYHMFSLSDGALVEVALTGSGATPFAAGGPSTIGAFDLALVFAYAGIIAEWGGVSRALTGAAGVGNPCTGELAQLGSYAVARYSL